jgi:hypothetical protein
MSLKRKLVAGGAALLVAGGAAGAGLAASGHDQSAPAVRQVRLESTTKAGFLAATAQYLGTDIAALRHQEKAGRTLAEIANATPGRSAKQLVAQLVEAASTKLRLIANRALATAQQRALRMMLRHRISGFLNDTCPLSLSGLGKHLGGCSGMSA